MLMKNITKFLPLACLILFNIGLFAWAYTGAAKWLSVENGMMENAQVALVLITGLVYLYAGYKNSGAIRSAAFLMFGVCMIGFIREVDFRQAPDAYAMIKYLFGPARDIVFAIIGIIMVGYIVLVRAHFSNWISIMLSWQAWAFYLSIAFIAASFASPNFLPHGVMEVFIEEALELNGYALLLIASFELSKAAYQELQPAE